MSAQFDQMDANWIAGCTPSQRKLTEMEEALVLVSFDTQTDHDIENIKKDMLSIKTIRKMCLIKVLMFVPEFLLNCMLMDKGRIRVHLECTKLYINFMFKKLSLDQFNKKLILATKNTIII